jgi:hypothetical protein
VKELVSLRRRRYPEYMAALQKDCAALWGPLSDLLKQLAEIVKM